MPHAPKLLILSVSAGSGHTRAAAALEEAARALHPAAEVRHVDVLSFTDPLYRASYSRGFLQLVQRAPQLYGAFYKSTDSVGSTRFGRLMETYYDRLQFRRFARYVREFNPDVVLATHFLPVQVIATWRRAHRRFTTGLVITDFDAHAYWVQPQVDRTFVASDEVGAILAARGVAPERIVTTGIPIVGSFAHRHPRAALRRRLGLRSSTPVLLVMGGGAGVGTLVETVRVALACGPVQVLAVAGRNEALRAKLRRLRAPAGSTLTTFGFTDEVDALMAAADLVVTKSGGLTSSECLAAGLPMVVIDPIPGQEERNCDYLLEQGVAVRASSLDALRFKLQQLLGNAALRGRMRRAARRAARPDAARTIVTELLRAHGAHGSR